MKKNTKTRVFTLENYQTNIEKINTFLTYEMSH